MLDAFGQESIQVALLFLYIGYRMGRGVNSPTLMDIFVEWLTPGGRE